MVSTFLGSNSADCRQWALCVVDDLIEHTGPDSWKYKDVFMSKMVDALVDGDASVRQAAAYGIGVAAQYGGESYAQATVAALETLFNIVNVPEARSEDNVYATENACTAIAKVLRKHGAQLGPNLDAALTEWVKSLPIVADEEAAPFSYMMLTDLIEQRHESVLTQVPKVLESVAQAIVHASLQGKSAAKTILAVKGLIAQIPQEQAMEGYNGLSPECQQVVQEWFKNEGAR
jgi:hypothetical protein